MTLPTLNVWGDIDENGAPNGNSIIGTYEGERIAVVIDGPHHDAFLRIAFAASDLLAALETMESLYADHAQYDDEGYEIAAIKATQDAIAKAKNALII